jgi:hypothetical protein
MVIDDVNPRQILQTVRPLQSEDGKEIPSGARVVAVGFPRENKVEVKVDDFRLPALRGKRVVTGAGAFRELPRGRPSQRPRRGRKFRLELAKAPTRRRLQRAS